MILWFMISILKKTYVLYSKSKFPKMFIFYLSKYLNSFWILRKDKKAYNNGFYNPPFNNV